MKNLKIENIDNIDNIKETILGKINLKDSQQKIITLPKITKSNQNIAVLGNSNSGKTRCFTINHILQCVNRKESLVIVDNNDELYNTTSEYLKDNGYVVKIFNLDNPSYSDSGNCLQEINSNAEQLELMAQVFAEDILTNISLKNDYNNHTCDSVEIDLLKTLSLLILTDENKNDSVRNIGSVYKLLINTSFAKLTAMFDRLPSGHPAKKSWAIFKQCPENIRDNAIMSLCSKLQLFQSPDIINITTYSEIDLELLVKQKCALFIIPNKQLKSINILYHLILSNLFSKLINYSNINNKPIIPVNFIFENFNNLPIIPNFYNKISMLNNINIALIFQTIHQLKNKYINEEWEKILSYFDTYLIFGCLDYPSIKLLSEKVNKETFEKLDELTDDHILIIFRGKESHVVDKFDYIQNTEHLKLKPVFIRNNVPHKKINFEE